MNYALLATLRTIGVRLALFAPCPALADGVDASGGFAPETGRVLGGRFAGVYTRAARERLQRDDYDRSCHPSLRHTMRSSETAPGPMMAIIASTTR